MIKKNTYKDWDDFFKIASSLQKHEKGLLFEQLIVHILKVYPIYASILKNVWLLREGCPTSIKKKLNLPNTDEGIDIIAETFSGEFWAIQCKFKASKEPPTMRELSTFNNLAHTHCNNISRSILFHTGERGVRKKHLMGEKYTEIGLEFWIGLTPQDWNSINDASKSKKSKPEVRKPREHQNNAIKQAQKHFISNNESKGRLIMPCGTGKSLTAFWIANSIHAKSVIVAVPSLNLIKQSLEDWTAEFVALNENPKPEWQVICSDDSTSKLQDEFVSDVYSLGIPTTTNIDEISDFLKRKTKGRKIIFTTYQSSDRLAEASRKAKFSFDLAILDEAHKTVGVKSKSFATLLSDTKISIKKRMFMTATERVLKGTNDDVLSMDDESVYGKRFYQLTFKDAIHSSPQIISDYKILTIAVTNNQIQEIIQKNKLLSDHKNKIEEQDAQSLAAAIALRQATMKYGIKHAISFHKSIKAAESFTKLNERLNSSKIDKVRLSPYHISSQKTAGQRSQLLEDFKNEQLALMTNARCLTEGVNVPTIDCVLFADPKQSIVDIVQAAGRALRVSPGKKYGYIMMPLIVPDRIELEKFTESTPFKQIARIVTALSTQDERIVEEFKLTDQEKKKTDNILEISCSIPIDFNIDISSFSSSIKAKMWEKIGKANWRTYDESRKYTIEAGLKTVKQWNVFCKSKNKPPDIPTAPQTIYKNSGWKSWASFFDTDNIRGDFWDYKTSEAYVRKLALNKEKDFRKYKQGLLISLPPYPKELPKNPDTYYKNNGKPDFSWGDFLGTKSISTYKHNFLEYEEAKKYISKFEFKTWDEFRKWAKGLRPDLPTKPSFIPKFPRDVYFQKGWKGIGDWLGTNSIANFNKEFYTFHKARTYVRKLNLRTLSNWQKYSKTKRPSFIPSHPDQTYKNSGWKGWPDFLGKK